MCHPPPRLVGQSPVGHRAPLGQSQRERTPAPTRGHPDNPGAVSRGAWGALLLQEAPLPPEPLHFKDLSPVEGVLSLSRALAQLPRAHHGPNPAPASLRDTSSGRGLHRSDPHPGRLLGEVACQQNRGAAPPPTSWKRKGTFGATADQAPVARNNMKYYLRPQHRSGAAEPETCRNWHFFAQPGDFLYLHVPSPPT